HVLRIRKFTGVLLENVMYSCPEYELNDRAIQVIAEAAALHDIGKIAIADTILNKPGRLTDEEFEIMKTHTVRGCQILSSLGKMGDEEYLKYAYNICRYHHERWNGKGYPDGLIGDNTPVYAQAVGIADAYDALTTDRVYKKAIQPERALNMILNGECGMFSPKLLECLKNVR
ncbi:HD domain-containing protein, partial [Romboutsia ilealis]|nr:HD domain-containing protein [Romboutsia ilealis]